MSKNDDKTELQLNTVALQENPTNQQKQLSALKEHIRMSGDTNVAEIANAQERVRTIGERFMRLRSKVQSRQGLNAGTAEIDAGEQSLPSGDEALSTLNIAIAAPSFDSTISTMTAPEVSDSTDDTQSGSMNFSPRSERMQLLRQQMKETKLLMAQRTSSQANLQQKMTQLRNKLNVSQQNLQSAAELGRSMNDLGMIGTPSATAHERHKSATDLASQPFNLDKERIKFLDNRCRLLEKQLEKERQGTRISRIKYGTGEEEIIVAAVDTALLSRENEQLSNEIRNLQEKLDAEQNEKEEYSRLGEELAEKLSRIAELEEVNEVLETTRCYLSKKQLESEELIERLQSEVQTVTEKQRESEAQIAMLREISGTEKEDDGAAGAGAAMTQRNTDTQVKDEMAKQIQELQEELEQLKRENTLLRDAISDNEKVEVSDALIAGKIDALEATIESQREDLQARMQALQKCEEDLMEKTIELNVLNANFKVLEEKLHGNSRHKPLFSSTGDGANDAAAESQAAEVQQLKQKLDESNKAMIKLKLKCKQTEKQMEKLKKLSDLHAEIIRLEKANEELQQKVIELEDEKGQWQLAHVDESTKVELQQVPHQPADQNVIDTSPQQQQQETCRTHAETIRLLEQQKYEQNEKLEATLHDLHALQEQFSSSEETTRVKSQMSEIHLEEQLEEQAQLIDSLQVRLSAQESETSELRSQLEEQHAQRQTVDKKLQHYITENIELLDKVEKLSKSSSSAESIEIVERLTQQERAEIDEFNSRHEQEEPRTSSVTAERNAVAAAGAAANSVSELTQTEMGPELSESLAKLREESSELMTKIELFTTERREVLEKMEHLMADNQELLRRVDELTEQKEQFETNALLAEDARSKLESRLHELTREKDLLATQVAESSAQRSQLSQELTSMQTSSEVVASLDGPDGATLFDKCEKSLSKLNWELESYRRANDKNAKFNACKKLAKEAKNAYTQLSELLVKVKEASSAVETVTVVETVVAVTAPNGKALAEYEQLTAQNRALKTTVADLRRELQDVREASVAEPQPPTSEVPAIALLPEMPAEVRQQLERYEEQCLELQSTVEDLRRELREARLAEDGKQVSITLLKKELETLRKLSDDFDCLINNKEMSYEKQIEHLTRMRRELEGKCETYEAEMEILQTLVAEQKQQLIEAYKGGEHEMNMKLLALQQSEEEIVRLRDEVAQLKQASAMVGAEVTANLQDECEKLHESLRINKALVGEQLMELSNKQETIDTLNQQLIELYKSIEENANKIAEKEDEIAYMQELLDTNNKELERLRKDNDGQKSVVDKLLNELHSHRVTSQLVPQLESDLQRLEKANAELERANKELEQRNKEQLEKLKKYAANLKKRTTHCLDLEARLKALERNDTAKTQDAGDNNSSQQLLQLEQLTADNAALRDQLAQSELRLHESEAAAKTIQDALQLKTVELLDKMERDTSLENTLAQLQKSLEQKTLETVQLQNALAASQEQTSDWGDEMRANHELKRNEPATQETTRLEEELSGAHENLRRKTEEILELRNELRIVKEQASFDWGDSRTAVVSSIASEGEAQLMQKLAEGTMNLERTEAALTTIQSELMQLRENEKEHAQSLVELELAVQQKNEIIREMQQQNATMQAVPNQEQRLAELAEELRAKSAKFEKSKAVIKDRNNQITRLQAQLKDLREKLSSQPEEEEEMATTIVQMPLAAAVQAPTAATVPQEQFDALQQSYDKLNTNFQMEKANFLATSERLETLHDGIQAKLQEDMAYIEALELDNAKFREKICKLEECVAMFEERRASMERRANLLHSQMQTRADEYEKTEDALVYRLNALSEHDDVIAQRLLDSQEEKEELQEQIDRLQAELKEMSGKHSKLEKEHQAYQEQVTASVETENATLREKLATSAAETTRLCAVYDAKLAAKTTEIDELECDLSDQLEKMNAEKRRVAEECERARDEVTALKDEIVRIYESLNALEQSKNELEREATWLRMENGNSQQELQEMRMQTMQDKTENDNLRNQIETLAANHDLELQGLRTQISELDTLRMQVGQNQTDDQVFIETENKRLTDRLAEKEALIENYQRQNLQLQMAAETAAAAAPAQLSPPVRPGSFGAVFGSPLGGDERERFERDLAEKSDLVARLQAELYALQAGNSEMQRLLGEREREVESLKSAHATPSAASTAASDEIIAAPPAFFGFEQAMVPSPFDEIVQVRTTTTTTTALEAGGRTRTTLPTDETSERVTIEDLQRNVCDLEKHAQDLENKLAMRNQREGEYEERLQTMQARLHEADSSLRERECLLQQALQEQQRLQQQLLELQQSASDKAGQKQEQFEQLQTQVQRLEAQLADERQRQQQQQQLTEPQREAAARLEQELQAELMRLQMLLQQRDTELLQLKLALDEAAGMQKQPQQPLPAPPPQAASVLSALESQIVPLETLQGDAAAFQQQQQQHQHQQQPTLDMFFGGVTSAPDFENLVFSGDQPVVEEVIVPKRSYLCHPDEEKSGAITALDLGDDWGDTWGAGGAGQEEPVVEAVHNNSALSRRTAPSLLSVQQRVEMQLQEAEERLRELQRLLDQSEQQRDELQAKSAKMLKKLKEYKAKNDELSGQVAAAAGSGVAGTFRKSISVESNSFFGDLDATIQDELKAQIGKIEAQLSEERKALAHAAAEKEKLLKRIDVLTAGNERMAEMKERQDMDVQMYQARIHDLQAKLDNLNNWQDEPRDASAPEQTPAPPPIQLVAEATTQLEQRIAELADELREVGDDRQELQAQLEDERGSVERAEQTVRGLQEKLAALENAAALKSESVERTTAMYNELRHEHQNLLEAYSTARDEFNALQTLQRDQIVVAQQAAEVRQQEADAFRASLQTTEANCGELQAQLLALRTQHQELAQTNEERLQTLADECEELRKQKETIAKQLAELQQQQQQTDVVRQQQQTQTQTPASNQQLISDELSAKLQEKEAEIFHLKRRIEDLMREDQTEKLVLEILTKNQEIHMLKMQVKNLEEDKLELKQNLSQQSIKMMKTDKDDENANSSSGGGVNATEERLRQLEKYVPELENEKRSMEEELKVLNNHVMASLDLEDKMKGLVLNLDAKNIEVAELRKSLEALKMSSISPADTSADCGTQIAALNANWEVLAEQRCTEIAQRWREHVEGRELEFKRMEAGLLEEIALLRTAAAAVAAVLPEADNGQHGVSGESSTATTTAASEPSSSVVSGSSSAVASKEHTPLHAHIRGGRPSAGERTIEDNAAEDDAVIIEKMQAALESQEMEIVTLKEQLAIRSAEYARLAAQYDPFKLQTTLSHSGMNLDAHQAKRVPSGGGGGGATAAGAGSAVGGGISGIGGIAGDVVPKSELDFALYTLYQRDMRYEETKLELVSLMEERDTLQLKLSHTLRQLEEIKGQSNYVELQTDVANATSAVVASGQAEIAVVPALTIAEDELSQKLSQLQTVNHSRDKVSMEEHEQRLRHMEKIEQDVANMPQAAVSELIGIDLSAQSNQSPSSVLLSWLWGNNKPNSAGGGGAGGGIGAMPNH